MSTSKPNSRKAGKYLKLKEKSKFLYVLPCLPVIIVFASVTVMAWLIPLRPTMSENENRNLEKFPEFSFDVLIDGTYFDDIGVWFSDTFTFRETWIDTATNLQSLYGSKTVAIYGDIDTGDDIPVINLSTSDTDEKPTTVEDETDPTNSNTPTGENQSELPTEIEVSTEDANDFDPRDEGVDEAPDDATKNSWGGQVIEEDEYVGTSGVIQIGNAAYGYTGFSQYYADRYSELMNEAVEILEGKARLFSLLTLENTTFMLSREDRIEIGCKPEEDAIQYMYHNMDSRIWTVSVFDKLVSHNSEYLAFRTDHHWTATAAYYAYECWCDVAGIDPVPLSEYEVIEYSGFKGSSYASALKSNLLEPDTVVCYVPPGNIKLYLSDKSDDRLGWEQPLITDRSHAAASGKYMAFLAGDHAKGTFINNDITDGSSCLVIKTSVGNPFVYYLTQHYQYVYVLDIRYYFGRDLASFVDYYEVDDVLFVHGTGFAMSSGGTDLINSFIH